MGPEDDRRFNEIEKRLDADEKQTKDFMALMNMGRGIGKFIVIICGAVTFLTGLYTALATFIGHK